jgi:NAD(P)-dependent dehydrogenase (short-subunit alcohol dehydrogenase family)
MTALITGAGSGIGLQLARLLLGRAEPVAVVDLRLSGPVRDELEGLAGAGGLWLGGDVDVRDPASVATAVAAAVSELGPPRLVVNCAGISRNDPFAVSRAEDFEQTIAVNLVGSRNVAAATLPHLGPGARLALVASLAGITGSYAGAAYSASKAGVIGLARVLRMEYAPAGIGVSVICPPEIMTPMVEQYATTMHPATRALKDVAGTLPLDEACREMLDQLDRGRFVVIPGSRARRTARVARLLPDALTMRLTDRIVRRAIAGAPTPRMDP